MSISKPGSCWFDFRCWAAVFLSRFSGLYFPSEWLYSILCLRYPERLLSHRYLPSTLAFWRNESLRRAQEIPEWRCRQLLPVQWLYWRFDLLQHFLQIFCSRFFFLLKQSNDLVIDWMCQWISQFFQLGSSFATVGVKLFVWFLIWCVSCLARQTFLFGFAVIAEVEKVLIKFGEDLNFIVVEYGTVRRKVKKLLQTK